MATREKNPDSTEEQILQAARKVFLKKGLEGARMQEIADEAGINKALLHYYFRSKDKLFEKVFNEVLQEFLPALGKTLQSDSPLIEKITGFTLIYFDLLAGNPFIPQFIIGELNRNPDGLKIFVEELSNKVIKPNFEILVKQVREEVNQGLIRPIDPVNLVVNIVSMSIFPFIGRPILSRLLFNDRSEEYDNFLENRKKHIPEFVMNALKP